MTIYTVIGIDNYAFYGSTSIKSVDIPKTVESIGKMAFSGCTSLEKITVNPQNQKYYAKDNVLYNFTQTELIVCAKTKTGNFTVPTDVDKIDEYAFHGCSEITSIVLPSDLKTIEEGAFSGCSKLASINIPRSITEILASTFSGCKLTSITLPEGLETIGEKAFYNNGTTIDKVEIPESVTSIGKNAFNETNVKNFYINNIPSKIALDANTPFQDSEDTRIHVFTQMEGIFENAPNWSNYAGHFAADIDIVHVESIELDNKTMVVLTNATGQLTATIHPDNARVKDVIFTSDDNNVITILDPTAGTFIAGAKEDEATITCTTTDGTGLSAQCKITVLKSFTPATGVTLDYTEKSLEVGNNFTLSATVSPKNATYKNITWVSSDEKVVTVNNGNLTAVGPGNATITAISGDGAARAKCSVVVVAKVKIPYIDENGNEQTCSKYTVLDGTETSLGKDGEETWYVCNTPATENEGKGLVYTGGLILYGNVRLILADKAAMTCSGLSKYSSEDNLTIYGQSIGDDMGKLTATKADGCIDVHNLAINGGEVTTNATSYNGNGILADNVTINGGKVNAIGDYVGIWATNDFTISGGKVKAEGYNGILAQNTVSITGGTVEAIGKEVGIWATNDLTISGGQVKATCSPPPNTVGIFSNYGDIHLGYTNADDYIFATSYDKHSPHTISVDANAGQWMMAVDADGKSSSAYTGDFSSGTYSEIGGKTLRRAQYKITAPDEVSVTVKRGSNPAEYVEVTEGSVTTPYYIYKEGLTVTAALKNTALVADYFTDTEVAFTDGEVTVGRPAVNAVEFDLPDADVTLSIDNLGAPTGGTMYLGIQDDNNNLTVDDASVEILAYQGLEVVDGKGLCAKFASVSEVPEGATCILANKTEGAALPATVPVSTDNSAAADATGEQIKAISSPLLTIGLPGQTLGDVLAGAVTDENGQPRTENGAALSSRLTDYVPATLVGESFRPVVADPLTPLIKKNPILFLVKDLLLKYLNRDNGSSEARTRSSASGIRYIPIAIGSDATGIRSLTPDPSPMGEGSEYFYTLDGRRLNGAPTQKGVYVNSGMKVIVK
ncbi:MAG: leucine-rich repeat protein [Prevotella sp.]|nr:leucine-rich repeat protein [Prevotella sp.]